MGWVMLRPRVRRASVAGLGAGLILVVVLALSVGLPRATSGVVPASGTNSDAAPGSDAAAAPAGTPGADAAAAQAQLSALQVVSGYSDIPYDRDRFGQRWADVDRNGCDTRNDVLGRDLLDPVFKAGTNNCKVLSGLLIDPYDGVHVDFVSGFDTSVLVQIDHVVALGWSWGHGAEYWTDELRTQFANDPRNLVAASEEMNQEKSASGPSDWLPPVPELRCTYVENFIDVLDAYDLGINSADKAAAQAVLEGC